MPHDARPNIQTRGLGVIDISEYQGRSPVRNRGGIGRRHRATVTKRRFKMRDFFRPRRAWLFIGIHHQVTATGRNSDGGDLMCESTAVLGRQSLTERPHRIFILRLAGELKFLCTILGKTSHQAAFVIGILQPVKEHVINHLPMADARSPAHFGQKIRRI